MKIIYRYLLTVCWSLAISVSVQAQQEIFHRVSAKISPEVIRRLRQEQLLPDHASYKNGLFVAEIPESEIAVLEREGIRFEYLVRDLAKNTTWINQQIDQLNHFDPAVRSISMNGSVSRSGAVPVNFSYGSMGGHYTYAEAMLVLDEMRLRFPQLVSRKDTIGFTHENRPIVAVRISDNPDGVEANENEWMMTAVHHANEVIGMGVLYYYVWHLLENYDSNPEYRYLLNNSALYIIPVINPDGLVYNESTNPAGGGTWRKNRKPRVISGTTHYGVDLNRNYGYKWAYSSTGQAGSNFAGNQYYRGLSAWSEKETMAMRDFVNQRQLLAAFNFHAWDDSFNYPWNFETDSLPPDSVQLKAISALYTQKNHFEEGTFNSTLGYTANGTSDDWMYGEQVSKPGIFSFTIEVGKSFWPAQSQILLYCDSLLDANIDMLRIVNKYAKISGLSNNSISQLSVPVSFNLKRYSVQGQSFTVSVIPLSANIQSVEAPRLFSSMDFLQTVSDTIDLQLTPAISNGDLVQYVVRVDNGVWATNDTITRIYTTGTLPFGCDDRNEPNNIRQAATEMKADIPMLASLQSKTDTDWYSVEASHHKPNLRIVLFYLPADYDMKLYNSQGILVAKAAGAGRMNDTIVLNNCNPGIYYLEVSGYKQAYTPNKCYSIKYSGSDTLYPPVQTMENKFNDPGKSNLQLYPSPARDVLFVKIESNKGYEAGWVLTDGEGKVVLKGVQTVLSGIHQFLISLKNLPKGQYVFVLMNGKKRVQSKVISIQ